MKHPARPNRASTPEQIVLAGRLHLLERSDDEQIEAWRKTRPRALTVHSSEISARAFRTSFRGWDRRSVVEWLDIVEASHATLEDELERMRSGWDEMLIACARKRNSPDASWGQVAAAITTAQPISDLLETRITADALVALRGPLRGLRRTRAALDEANLLLARSRNAVATLRRTNDELRGQLITGLTTGIARA